jgi:O-antigen ligase
VKRADNSSVGIFPMGDDLNAESPSSKSIRAFLTSVLAYLNKERVLAFLGTIRRELLIAKVRFDRKFSWKRAFRLFGLILLIAVYSFLVGGMVVVLPPMFAIATAAFPALLLIWAAPELRRVPTNLLHKIFFAVIVVEISVPAYYAVQIPGLPWISIRRLVVLCIIILLSVALSGSSRVREHVYQTLSVNKKIFICFSGYYVMCGLSILTAYNPAESISQFAEYTLNWYVPAIAAVIALRNIDDVRKVLKLIAWCSFIVAGLGVVDFVGQHNYAIDIIPKPLLNAMMSANPSFAEIVNSNPFRNGIYRSSSIYNVPLSYGEFAAMVAPIGGYFFFHGEKFRERVLGTLVILGSLASLLVSGARGGSVALVVSMPILFALWVARNARSNPLSMVGPLGGAVAFLATTVLFVGVAMPGRLHKMVLGGGEAASSDTARLDQFKLAVPHIISNPLTGHGIGNAGVVIGYAPYGSLTVDTSILSVVVDTGVPGLIFFFGMLILAAWSMARIYLDGQDRDSAVGVAFACSFIAFAVYRLVLSQRENQPLVFILLGAACVVMKIIFDRVPQKSAETFRSDRSIRPTAPFNSGFQPTPGMTAATPRGQ